MQIRRFGKTLAILDESGIELFLISDPQFRRWAWSEISTVLDFRTWPPALVLVQSDSPRTRAFRKTIPVVGRNMLGRDKKVMELFTLDFRPGTRPGRRIVARYLRSVAPDLEWVRGK